jgi:hypothetical protein
MTEFKTTLIKDATIRDITPSLDYGVVSGAASTTYQPFTAQSPSNSQLTFSVQVPSENIVLGRDILIQAGLTFRVTVSNVPVGEYAFQYGLTDSMQAFPLNSLLSTATVQINNTTCSINTQDVLTQLLLINDPRHLSKYNGMTPSFLDSNFGVYADAVGASSNPMSSFNNGTFDNSIVPRGSFPVSVSIAHTITAGGTDASPISTNLADSWIITISTVVCEPLILSPFTWGEMTRNAQGLVGINNITFTLNIDQSLKKLMSTSAPVGYNYNLLPGSAANGGQLFAAAAPVGILSSPSTPQILFKFLSVQPTDLLNPKNVVPYTDAPRYITSAANTAAIPAGGSATIQTSNLQLNQLPSRFLVCVRKPMNLQTARDSNSFLTITGVSINLNNKSGLLSSCSQFDLYRLSKRAGSSQSWSAFSGQAWVNKVVGGVQNGALVPTTGSLLVLNPSLDLSLESWLANGSLGNFNLQMQITCSNQFGAAITPEIVIVCLNDGLMTTTQGVSSVYTGILTRQIVMDAQKQPSMSSAEEAEVVGGRMLSGHSMRNPVGGLMSGAGARSRLSGMY